LGELRNFFFGFFGASLFVFLFLISLLPCLLACFHRSSAVHSADDVPKRVLKEVVMNANQKKGTRLIRPLQQLAHVRHGKDGQRHGSRDVVRRHAVPRAWGAGTTGGGYECLSFVAEVSYLLLFLR
jgi:hypothetical protein